MNLARLRAIQRATRPAPTCRGWFTVGNILFQAALMALFGEGR